MPRNLVSTVAVVLLVCLIDFATAGNTTCAGNMTQWYTDAVGETACMTYQRVRQICNPNYQVPNFRPVAPGDQCDDGLSFCCCNSVAWGLSMLCMNCQWDVIGGPSVGINANPGSYTSYRTLASPSGQFCAPGTNQSFSSDIQSAVCNEGIKIADFLYNLYWDTGSWFYEFTMDAALKDKAASNNNMYTHCNSTTSTTSTIPGSSTSYSQSTTSTSSTTTSSDPQAAKSSNTPTIVGAVVGGTAVLVIAAAVAVFCWRRRRSAGISSDVNREHAPEMGVISPYTVPNTTPGNQNSYGYDYAQTRGHRPTSRNSAIPPSTTTLATTVGGGSWRSSDLLANRGSSISALRHEDGGAVSNVERSWSGRLPPAYDNIWQVTAGEPPEVEPLVKPDSSPSHVGQGV